MICYAYISDLSSQNLKFVILGEGIERMREVEHMCDMVT
jgi:hypothetical protein